MKLILGLGNPGEKYENTRHNLGYKALDKILEEFEPVKKTFWEEEKKLKSLVKKVDFEGNPLLLAKPTTFMNLSGEAASAILNYYKIDSSDMTVIYDDIDIPFGNIRVRFGGASGGHNGVNSIINSLNSDQFLRLRLGIGRDRQKTHDTSDYVLGSISSAEKGKTQSMLKETVKNVELILKHGLEEYMSRYNK